MNAADFCKTAHAGQFRMDGLTPYWTHPFRTVEILKRYLARDYHIYDDAINAMFLHDTYEDCPTVTHLLIEGFSKNVHVIVTCLTDPTKDFDFKVPRDIKLQLKLRRTMNHELGPLMKICDRIANLEDTDKAPKKWVKKYLSETLDMFMFYEPWVGNLDYTDFEPALEDLNKLRIEKVNLL